MATWHAPMFDQGEMVKFTSYCHSTIDEKSNTVWFNVTSPGGKAAFVTNVYILYREGR